MSNNQHFHRVQPPSNQPSTHLLCEVPLLLELPLPFFKRAQLVDAQPLLLLAPRREYLFDLAQIARFLPRERHVRGSVLIQNQQPLLLDAALRVADGTDELVITRPGRDSCCAQALELPLCGLLRHGAELGRRRLAQRELLLDGLPLRGTAERALRRLSVLYTRRNSHTQKLHRKARPSRAL